MGSIRDSLLVPVAVTMAQGNKVPSSGHRVGKFSVKVVDQSIHAPFFNKKIISFSLSHDIHVNIFLMKNMFTR